MVSKREYTDEEIDFYAEKYLTENMPKQVTFYDYLKAEVGFKLERYAVGKMAYGLEG